MYLQDRIDTLRKDIDKHGKVKTKKGQPQPPPSKVFPLHSILSSSSLCSFLSIMNPTPKPIFRSFGVPCLSDCLSRCS